MTKSIRFGHWAQGRRRHNKRIGRSGLGVPGGGAALEKNCNFSLCEKLQGSKNYVLIFATEGHG